MYLKCTQIEIFFIIEKKNIHHIVIHIRQNESPFVKS